MLRARHAWNDSPPCTSGNAFGSSGGQCSDGSRCSAHPSSQANPNCASMCMMNASRSPFSPARNCHSGLLTCSSSRPSSSHCIATSDGIPKHRSSTTCRIATRPSISSIGRSVTASPGSQVSGYPCGGIGMPSRSSSSSDDRRISTGSGTGNSSASTRPTMPDSARPPGARRPGVAASGDAVDQQRATGRRGVADLDRAVQRLQRRRHPGPFVGTQLQQRFTVAHLLPLALQQSEEHTSELQSNHDLVCRLLLEKKKKNKTSYSYHNILHSVAREEIKNISE